MLFPISIAQFKTSVFAEEWGWGTTEQVTTEQLSVSIKPNIVLLCTFKYFWKSWTMIDLENCTDQW